MLKRAWSGLARPALNVQYVIGSIAGSGVARKEIFRIATVADRVDECGMRCFVYGTLMRGRRAHGMLAGQKFVSEARTAPGYRLFDCGGFPGLVKDPRGGVIHGEVWEIDSECKAALDEYEGVPEGLYDTGTLGLETGEEVAAYFFKKEVTGLRDCGGRWPKEWETADPGTGK